MFWHYLKPNTPNIQVANQKSGFKDSATEESKNLVKRVYYVMKRVGLFYNFQRSFFNMKGLTKHDEDAIRNRNIYPHDGIIIGDIIYKPLTTEKESRFASMVLPKLVIELLMIQSMLTTKASDSGDIRKLDKAEVLGHYVKFHFKDCKKTKPTGLMVEYLFGIFGTIVFTALFFLLLSYITSSSFVAAFGVFILSQISLTTFILIMESL